MLDEKNKQKIQQQLEKQNKQLKSLKAIKDMKRFSFSFNSHNDGQERSLASSRLSEVKIDSTGKILPLPHLRRDQSVQNYKEKCIDSIEEEDNDAYKTQDVFQRSIDSLEESKQSDSNKAINFINTEFGGDAMDSQFNHNVS